MNVAEIFVEKDAGKGQIYGDKNRKVEKNDETSQNSRLFIFTSGGNEYFDSFKAEFVKKGHVCFQNDDEEDEDEEEEGLNGDKEKFEV
jgi:hypothetical protein